MYGLIFDVDGVIADSESINADASIEVFKILFGMDTISREDFAAGLGRGADAYLLAAAAVHQVEFSPDQLATAVQMRQDLFLQRLHDQGIVPYPGVVELMETARCDGRFKLAIATSSTREKSQAVLQGAKINTQDMVYISGSEVTHKKPHPEVFAKAIAGLQLPTQNCVVIEDAPNGIDAAHAAGAKCVAVSNTALAADLADADQVVSSLTQINLETLVRLMTN